MQMKGAIQDLHPTYLVLESALPSLLFWDQDVCLGDGAHSMAGSG